MSDSCGDWGDMVIPGVYMIQRTPNSETLSRIVQTDGALNLELLHLEIEEAERHIELLKKSNVEIAAYLKEKRECEEDGEQGGGMASMIAATDGATEEEDEDFVFREALEENVLVIAKKEHDLAQLKELIKGQRCGCSCARSSSLPEVRAEPAPPSQTRIVL